MHPPCPTHYQFSIKTLFSKQASEVVKVEGEDPATPGCPREDMVRRNVDDSKSFVRAPLAPEETPGP